MKKLAVTMLMMAAAAFGQQWEFGGVGGGGFLRSVNVNGGVSAVASNATAGFQTGFAAGAFVGQNLYRHLAGQIRYEFLQSDLSLKSGGSSASFAGMAHAIHYDLVLHTAKRGSRSQVFVAFGGGMKVFRGTGTESAYQPLSQFGYFTKTTAVKPMASVGAGVRWALGEHVYLRAEVRDFITPFPEEIITPAPGMKYGSLLHDVVPMVGISYEFQ